MKITSLIACGLLIFLTACQTAEPVRVVVTPTPEQVGNVVSPTLEVVNPVVANIMTQSPTPATVIVTPTSEPTRTAIAGDGSYIGSVLGGVSVIPSGIPQLPTVDATATLATTPMPTATAIPTQPSITVPVLNTDKMGIQVNWYVEGDAFGQIVWQTQQLKMGWIKFQANWALLQPNDALSVSEAYNAFVSHVQSAENAGLKTLISVTKAPRWARTVDSADDGTPDDVNELANFLRRLITDIKPENIHAIEIWNEPNLRREWHGTLPFSGEGYMRLFEPAYQAIRELAPSVRIITAGLAPTSSQDGASVDDRVFLQQMYDAGLARYTDVSVGVHPYGWGNPPDARCCDLSSDRGWDDNPHFFFLDNLDETRSIMVNNGHGGVQMFVTEFGWATWEGFPSEAPEPWLTYITPEQQATYVLRAFEIGQAREDIGGMILWNLNYASEELINDANEIAGFSLMVPSFDPTGDPLKLRPLYRLLEQRS